MAVGERGSGKRTLLWAARRHLAANSTVVDLQLGQSWRRGINSANRLLDSLLEAPILEDGSMSPSKTHLLQANVGGLGPKVLRQHLLPFARRLAALDQPGISLLLSYETPGDGVEQEFREVISQLPGTTELGVPKLLTSRYEIALFVTEMARQISDKILISVDFLEALLLHDWRHYPSEMAEQVYAALESAALEQRLVVPADLQLSARTTVARPTRQSLLKSLREYSFNVTAAAKARGWRRRQVYRWIATLGIELPKTGRKGRRSDLQD